MGGSRRTIISRRSSRGARLLRPLGLGLVYHLLLLLPLMLVVLGLLGLPYRPLVGEAVEDAKGEGGPPKNLDDESQLAPWYTIERRQAWSAARRGMRMSAVGEMVGERRVEAECTHVDSGRHRRGSVGRAAIGWVGIEMDGGGGIRDQTIAVNWPCPGESRELRALGWRLQDFKALGKSRSFSRPTAPLPHRHTSQHRHIPCISSSACG